MSELPKGWRRVPLSEVAEVRLGRQRAPKHEAGEYLRPYLRAANVGWNGLKLDDVKSMNFEPREFETFRLRDGDVLLSEASGSPDEVGKPAIFRGEVEGCCFQNTLIRVRARRDEALPEYLHLHFLADARLGRFAAFGKGSGINHLGGERMAAWPVALPPLDEQRRIVAKLDALQERSRRAREALDAVPPLLDKLRQSILAAAFRGDLTKDWRTQHPKVEPAEKLLERIRRERRLRWEEAELAKLHAKGKAPKDDRWKDKYVEPKGVDASELPELPEGWCWASVEEVGLLQLGQRRAPEHADGEQRPYIRAGNITWRGLDLTDVKSMGFTDPRSVELQAGDILLTEASGSVGEVGKPALWRGEIARCCYQATVLRVRSQTTAIAPDWLYFSFLADARLGRFAAMAPGIGILHLTAERMKPWPVPVPPREEQALICTRLQEQLARLEASRAATAELLGQLAQQERSVLAKAFRGEL